MVGWCQGFKQIQMYPWIQIQIWAQTDFLLKGYNKMHPKSEVAKNEVKKKKGYKTPPKKIISSTAGPLCHRAVLLALLAGFVFRERSVTERW